MKIALGLVLAAATGGCLAADDGTDGTDGSDTDPTDGAGDGVAQTAQEISGGIRLHGYMSGDVDLGSSANQTCFLMAVKGSLKGYPGANGTPFSHPRAGVYRVNGRYRLQTNAGDGGGVQASAMCIDHVLNRQELRVTQGTSSGWNPYSPYIPISPDRLCFLSAIEGVGHGWTALQDVQPNDAPAVKIDADGVNWVFREWLIPNSNETPSGYANAVCVDIPHTTSSHWLASAPSGVTTTSTLVHDPGGMICGLYGIGGVYTDGFQGGARVHYDQVNHDWKVSVSNRSDAWVRCVR